MTKATLAYAIFGFCFGMLTVIVAEAISTKLALKRISKVGTGIVDLRTCKKGDILLTKTDIYFVYVDSNGAGGFPHRAVFGDTKVNFTDDGKFLADANSGYDIVRIIHLNGDQK